jgi:hypothetical protein
VLGYTEGQTLNMHVGLYFDFFAMRTVPFRIKDRVTSSPSIVHVDALDYLVAFATNTATQMEVRQFHIARGYGDIITPVAANGIASRPAMAYDPERGKLVLAWGRIPAPGAANPAYGDYRYLVGDYLPGDSAITNVTTGSIPQPAEYPRIESEADPALAYDGVGKFYLAVLGRSGVTGLTHDNIFIYQSTDGTNWSRIPASFPRFPAGTTNLTLAASSNGEFFLVVTVHGVGKLYQFQDGVFVGEHNPMVLLPLPPETGKSISLVPSQHFRETC